MKRTFCAIVAVLAIGVLAWALRAEAGGIKDDTKKIQTLKTDYYSEKTSDKASIKAMKTDWNAGKAAIRSDKTLTTAERKSQLNALKAQYAPQIKTARQEMRVDKKEYVANLRTESKALTADYKQAKTDIKNNAGNGGVFNAAEQKAALKLLNTEYHQDKNVIGSEIYKNTPHKSSGSFLGKLVGFSLGGPAVAPVVLDPGVQGAAGGVAGAAGGAGGIASINKK